MTKITELQLADARDKIHLQVEQSLFQVHDAETRLATARKNMASAEENLRCANIGFKEVRDDRHRRYERSDGMADSRGAEDRR